MSSKSYLIQTEYMHLCICLPDPESLSVLISLDGCPLHVPRSTSDRAGEAQASKGLVDGHLGPVSNRVQAVNSWPYPQGERLQQVKRIQDCSESLCMHRHTA